MASEKFRKAVKDVSDELAKHLPPGAAEHSTLIIYAAGGSVALLTLRALTRKFYKCAAAALRARAPVAAQPCRGRHPLPPRVGESHCLLESRAVRCRRLRASGARSRPLTPAQEQPVQLWAHRRAEEG